jgi:two-component system, cell cycle sensor histidine kinase and response regulator CckA
MTEESKYADALRESEQKYREIFENAPVGIFQTTPQGLFLSANPEYARMAGYSTPSEMIAQISDISAQLYVRPEERKRYKELLQRQGQVTNYEVELRRRDGSTFWVSMNARALKNRDGNIFYDGFLTDVTERVRAEQALRNAESLQRKMVANIGDVIVIIDPQGINRYKSPNIEKWFGWKPEEVIGFNTLENIHPEDKHFAQQFLGSLLNEPNATRTAQCRYRCKDGSYKWIEFTGLNLLHDPDIQGILGNYHDITERKKAEEALRESEEKFRSAFAASPDSVNINRLEDGLYVDINQGFTRLTGFTREDVIGKTSFEIGIWHDPADRQKLVRGVREKGFYENLEAQFRCKDGTLVTALMSAAIISIHNEPHIINITRDITELKEAGQSLRESEERFYKAFMSNPAPLVIAEIDTGRFIDVNDSWVQMIGYGKEEQIGRTSTELGIWINPDDRLLFIQKLESLGHFKDERVEFRNKAGGIVYALWSAELITLAGKQVILGMLHDESERKANEKERLRLQAQLTQAQKMESVGRLAGGVAHDYNNMLSVIVGFTEMAMDKMQPDDPLHADLAEILKAARRSIDITRQLLAFARKQTIAPKVVDLNTIVESMLRMLGRLIGENIDLAWMPGKQLWAVKIDPAQIDQILANLCVNARDAIEGVGKVTIETGNITFDDAYCEVHAGFLPGEFVLLAISDNGRGMDEETLGNIFEPFFTTKGVAEGTGLGLATVYGIVKQNNGYINVYSEPANGTTFRIYLPRHVGEQHHMIAATKIPTPVGRGETVLLVEDEPSIMRMAKMMLKRLGYQVLAVGSPRQALNLAEQHAGAIDLLITDVVMPEMSGRNLANQIHDLYPRIKTLFMSGYTANVIAHNGVLDEGVNFIQKPFSLHDLGIKVRLVLDENRILNY